MASYMVIKIPVELKKKSIENTEPVFEFKKGFEWILPEMSVEHFIAKLKEIDALFILDETDPNVTFH